MKNILIGGSIVSVIALAIVGTWFWHGHSLQRAAAAAVLSDSSTSGGANLSQPNQADSVPLNQSSSQDNSAGGLRVSSDGSRDLGQSGFGSSGSSLGAGSGQSTSGGSSSSSPFDPSTFSQYDKYKDGQDAMFAEVQKGDGDEVATNKKVAVYYRGWLTNGKLFDQSQTNDKGQLQPFTFTEGAHQVIPGWEEGLAGMKVGGTRMIIVPPAAGYGATGQGPIPGNSVLVFEVHLLAVQ